ncbi:tyrosine-type recombinase/integrase [Bacillus sp. FJAT-45350]|uniref:tyrosine-type recombinase/integrase n=1 Tax=Bacillus sp. FJAT-45350 TaxID=2011014 RepID=UPI000BB6F7B8|nr:tyrosine-type recombinase/integrase [Bacillus sp. FJAT-45350]
MEYVEPIKDIKMIDDIKAILKNKSRRDYLFFVFGINTGMLVSHLLNIKVHDVFDDDIVNEYYVLNEEKHIDGKHFYINKKVKIALQEYIKEAELNNEDYLFKSKKNNLPITRQQAYRIINNVAREVGIAEKVGTHTLRKTFGYHAYQKGIAISLLQRVFNHSTRAETLKYIGITKEESFHAKIDVNL